MLWCHCFLGFYYIETAEILVRTFLYFHSWSYFLFNWFVKYFQLLSLSLSGRLFVLSPDSEPRFHLAWVCLSTPRATLSLKAIHNLASRCEQFSRQSVASLLQNKQTDSLNIYFFIYRLKKWHLGLNELGSSGVCAVIVKRNLADYYDDERESIKAL